MFPIAANRSDEENTTPYSDDVFSTWLYTGNGSTQTITNGIDLAGKGGLVWIKCRNIALEPALIDTVNGANKTLDTTSTNQISTPTGSLTSFNSNGFSLGSNLYVNTAANYVSWTFRKAAKFFDVVTWTGSNDTGTNTGKGIIPHNLGAAPAMVILKNSTQSGTNWIVYHRSLTGGYHLLLNTTDAQTNTSSISMFSKYVDGVGWVQTDPDATNIYVGYNYQTNGVGDTLVAYLYAHDTAADGIIQCGSFTTDGSGNATVNLGWEPQYLLTKRADSTGYWVAVDTMRGFSVATSGGSDAQLYPNSSAAENFGGANINGGYPTATGFYANNGFYSASATYIYMAIRRPNKPPTTGTQVFMPSVKSANVNPQTVTTGFTVDWAWANGNIETAPATAYHVNRLSGTDKINTFYTGPESTYDGIVDLMYSNQYVNKTYTNSSTHGFGYAFSRAPNFFDIVHYTGNFGGSTTQQVLTHNLGVVPELIIGQSRSVGGYSYSYSVATGENYYLNIGYDHPASGPRTDMYGVPTATTFTVKEYTNTSGITYIAYLFSTCPGVSKVGSYIGNGSTGQAIACGFSAGARFVLIKRTDSNGHWHAFDSARGLTSGSSPYLLINGSAASAETTGNNGVYASAGGFTLATSAAGLNAIGGTYIFLAIA